MSEVRQKTSIVMVRVSPQELLSYRQRADQSGISVPEFLRRGAGFVSPGRDATSYRQRAKSLRYKADSDLLIQLSRIGNNLNQLTRLHHSGEAPHYNEVDIVLKKISQITDLILNELESEND